MTGLWLVVFVSWEDRIVELVGGDWTAIASDGHLWNLSEEGFVNLDVI